MQEATKTSSEPIKVGQLEIRYLMDGTAHAGLGLFALTVPAGSNVPPVTASAADGFRPQLPIRPSRPLT
jgi:hypothetical protein